jgi:alkanesulfonate monooxygenase SsuD/methylene tetrahydromethanopterin reductase-like flavin-dependent oxidoreductase (luciferase family)
MTPFSQPDSGNVRIRAICGRRLKTLTDEPVVFRCRSQRPHLLPNLHPPRTLQRPRIFDRQFHDAIGRHIDYSQGLRERIWWGAGSNATAAWAAKLGMNLQSSTLKDDETGEPFHVQPAAQIRVFRAAWKEAGHAREPRVSVSRSIFALVDDRDRAYFGRGGKEADQVGYIDEQTRAIFGRGYASDPDVLVEQLKEDEAIAEADTLLLAVPNQLGVAYDAHVIETILTDVAPALGWR